MVLEVCVAVRGPDGVLVDPGVLGVHGLVELMRAVPPPGVSLPGYVAFGASVDVLEAVEVVLGQVTALRAAAVHAVAADTPAGVVGDQVVEVVMMALGRSRRSGLFLREQALLLTHQPQVWAALWQGRLDVTKAGILARALNLVPRLDAEDQQRPEYAADCDRILASGLGYAAGHTAGQLDRHLTRLLAAIDPGAVLTRRRRALADRGVWIDHRGDGTADLTARLDSTHAEQVYAAIRALALATQRTDTAAGSDGGDGDGDCGIRRGAGHDCATDHGDPGRGFAAQAARRPFDLRMADALVDLVLSPAAASLVAGDRDPDDERHAENRSAAAGPARVTVSTQINVTIPIDSLAGLSDTPGTLSGYGVLPADLVRRLAAGDTRWRHILTDRATGAVLDVGTWSYRPPTALDRHVRTRDVTCRFPGCQVPARECDLDHLIPFPQGPTNAENLHTLCRRHHQLKHDDNWTVEPLPNSGLRWTSPHGTTRNTWPDTHQEHTTAA